MKHNLTFMNPKEAYNIIYKSLSKEFLLGSDFNSFLNTVQKSFVLDQRIRDYLLIEWKIKEEILKD